MNTEGPHEHHMDIEEKACEHVPVSPEVEARVDAAVKAGRINDKRDAEPPLKLGE